MTVIKTWSSKSVSAGILVVSLAACGVAQAQNPARDRDGIGTSTSYEDYLRGGDVRVSELVGMRVVGTGGNDLGEIEEVLLGDSAGGELSLIVSVGGILDIGDKLIARPVEDFRVAADGGELYLDVTEQQLSAEPSYSYVNEADEQSPSAAAPSTRAGAMGQRVAGLIGASVIDESGEEIGEVDDLVIPGGGGGEPRAVLSIGGIGGLGAKLVAVPFDDIEIKTGVEDAEGALEEPQVRVDLQADAVERLPEFEYTEREERTAAL